MPPSHPRLWIPLSPLFLAAAAAGWQAIPAPPERMPVDDVAARERMIARLDAVTVPDRAPVPAGH